MKINYTLPIISFPFGFLLLGKIVVFVWLALLSSVAAGLGFVHAPAVVVAEERLFWLGLAAFRSGACLGGIQKHFFHSFEPVFHRWARARFESWVGRRSGVFFVGLGGVGVAVASCCG